MHPDDRESRPSDSPFFLAIGEMGRWGDRGMQDCLKRRLKFRALPFQCLSQWAKVEFLIISRSFSRNYRLKPWQSQGFRPPKIKRVKPPCVISGQPRGMVVEPCRNIAPTGLQNSLRYAVYEEQLHKSTEIEP